MDADTELQGLLDDEAFLTDLIKRVKLLRKNMLYAKCHEAADVLLPLLAKERRKARRRIDDAEAEIMSVAEALSQAESDCG